MAIYARRIEMNEEAGNWEAVIKDLTKSIEIDQDNAAEHHFQRGQYHQKNGDNTAAESDYMKALDLGYDQSAIRDALVSLGR